MNNYISDDERKQVVEWLVDGRFSSSRLPTLVLKQYGFRGSS